MRHITVSSVALPQKNHQTNRHNKLLTCALIQGTRQILRISKIFGYLYTNPGYALGVLFWNAVTPAAPDLHAQMLLPGPFQDI